MANEAYWIAAQTGYSPCASGMPGVGKTQTIYSFARAVGRQCYTLIGSIRDAADIGGFPHPSHKQIGGREVNYMEIVPPKYAVDCQEGGWIIFLDEITTCGGAQQAALLRVLAEKVVGDMPLPEDTWILAACNPPEQAANGNDLEPPMANRLVHLPWEFDWDAWKQGMQSGGKFPVPQFPVLPADWRKHTASAASLLVAFLTRRPDLQKNFPKDRTKQSGAWASPRSWTMAATCLAACESVRAGKGIEYQLVAGCVGEDVAVEFASWRDALDLPDPEELIAEAVTAHKKKRKMKYDHPKARPDKVIALLSSVAAAIVNNNTAERWQAGMMILEAASEYEIDVALSCAGPFARNKPKDAEMSEEFVKNMFPKLKRLLLDDVPAAKAG